MTELARCVGCGGVLAVIGVRHLCHGSLLKAEVAERTKPTKRATRPVRTVSTERAIPSKRTEGPERQPVLSERTEVRERKAKKKAFTYTEPVTFSDTPKPVKLEDVKQAIAVRTIDERIADCPVCTARRKKEAQRQQKHRVKKSIPGRRK